MAIFLKSKTLFYYFLLQPNVENPLSPGAVYSTLPPLPGQVILIKLLNLVEFYCLAWLTWRDLYLASDICPSFSIGHLREPLGNGQTMCLHLPRWNSLNFLLSTLETIKH